jgi:hypothetical protein
MPSPGPLHLCGFRGLTMLAGAGREWCRQCVAGAGLRGRRGIEGRIVTRGLTWCYAEMLQVRAGRGEVSGAHEAADETGSR